MSTGLVLEGGGMRGWYTNGVLTVLQENGLLFPCIYGISAGAYNALTYISGQNSREYAAAFLKHIFSGGKTGNSSGLDFLFGDLLHRLMPFDFTAFFNSPVELKTGVTDLQTGRAEFFGKADIDRDFTVIRASCSLPFASEIVRIGGRAYLDGGCAMPIPLERSAADGNERHVVVLTREAGYRKSLKPEYPRAALCEKYGDYPAFIETMLHRGEIYNEELEICSRLEEAGKAIVIRPSRPILAGRYENDPGLLWEIYTMGICDCEAKLAGLKEFFKS